MLKLLTRHSIELLKIRPLSEDMKLSASDLTFTFDLYIVGVQKCGTTSVYEMFARSDDCITHPAAKDLPIFTLQNMPPKALAVQREIKASAALGVPKKIVGGEANLTFVEGGLERLFNHNPEMQLIYCVRAPLSRIESAVAYARQRGLITGSLLQILENEISEGAFYVSAWEHRQLSFIEHGRYKAQITRLLSWFPREQLFIINFDELRSSDRALMSKLSDFCSIKDLKEIPRENVTRGLPKLRVLATAIENPRRLSLLKRVLRRVCSPSLTNKLRKKIELLNTSDGPLAPREPIPESLEHLLAEKYAEDLAFLREEFGIDLGLYDR